LWICSKTREVWARHSKEEGGPFEKKWGHGGAWASFMGRWKGGTILKL